MGNVVAVGCIPLDLEMTCFGALSRCIKKGEKAFLIMVNISGSWQKKIADAASKSSNAIGISKIHFLEEFEPTTVTQDNVKGLRTIMEEIEPSLVVIPFIKASDEHRRVLACSSLLASRGAKNVLMYEPDLSNSSFQPNIYLRIKDEALSKIDCIRSYSLTNKKARFYQKKIQALARLHKAYSVKASTNVPTEAFQSHRMVLNDENLVV